MGFPKDVRVVETMIGTRAGELAKLNYTNLTGMKDKETEGFNFPAQYMFKDVPWSDQARSVTEEPEPPQGPDLLLPGTPGWGAHGMRYTAMATERTQCGTHSGSGSVP